MVYHVPICSPCEQTNNCSKPLFFSTKKLIFQESSSLCEEARCPAALHPSGEFPPTMAIENWGYAMRRKTAIEMAFVPTTYEKLLGKVWKTMKTYSFFMKFLYPVFKNHLWQALGQFLGKVWKLQVFMKSIRTTSAFLAKRKSNLFTKRFRINVLRFRGTIMNNI